MSESKNGFDYWGYFFHINWTRLFENTPQFTKGLAPHPCWFSIKDYWVWLPEVLSELLSFQSSQYEAYSLKLYLNMVTLFLF